MTFDLPMLLSYYYTDMTEGAKILSLYNLICVRKGALRGLLMARLLQRLLFLIVKRTNWGFLTSSLSE